MRIIITGYAGFIGSNLTRMLLNPDNEIMGLDAYTYAARPLYVREVLSKFPGKCFFDIRCDIRDQMQLESLVRSFRPDQVYHLAAESHVCRSIEGPRDFATTNFMGTFNLLEALRKSEFKGRLVHVSTDEAFGELEEREAPFYEGRHIDPRSPYAASKAASDLMVRAYCHTYGIDACITRCTNNYGPNQHEEKLIPKAILRFLKGEPMTLHGDGSHSRDWIYVDDHCRGLISVMNKGRSGELYCIGSGLEISNKEVAAHVALAIGHVTGKMIYPKTEFTNDRPTDDKRYAVNTLKMQEMGWRCPKEQDYFSHKLKETIRWYMENSCEKS